MIEDQIDRSFIESDQIEDAQYVEQDDNSKAYLYKLTYTFVASLLAGILIFAVYDGSISMFAFFVYIIALFGWSAIYVCGK